VNVRPKWRNTRLLLKNRPLKRFPSKLMTVSFSSRPKPVLLCILDGWGCSNDLTHNAISQANTPCWDRLLAHYPHAQLMTSGLDVGLPEGQMGNSEVGHMNIGAGRVVMQELPRISLAAQDGSLAQNAELQRFIATLKASGGNCHLLGLLSDGGVHGHITHTLAACKALTDAGVPVVVHAITDGRDVAPDSAARFIDDFVARMPKGASVGTVIAGSTSAALWRWASSTTARNSSGFIAAMPRMYISKSAASMRSALCTT
jgi:bisphosphoglycerate-independent phosphoglycerate mutase